MNNTKRVRLLARVFEVEEKLERLIPDLPVTLRDAAKEAHVCIVDVREGLVLSGE